MSAETTSRTIARFTVAVPRDLPTANHRLHWRERAARVRHARSTVNIGATVEMYERGLKFNRTESRTLHLTLIRGKGQRLLDHDGVYAALKPCVDGLVDAGWLVDDSSQWLPVYTVSQKKDNDIGPAVECEIGMPA
jgi:hypothetical protein